MILLRGWLKLLESDLICTAPCTLFRTRTVCFKGAHFKGKELVIACVTQTDRVEPVALGNKRLSHYRSKGSANLELATKYECHSQKGSDPKMQCGSIDSCGLVVPILLWFCQFAHCLKDNVVHKSGAGKSTHFNAGLYGGGTKGRREAEGCALTLSLTQPQYDDICPMHELANLRKQVSTSSHLLGFCVRVVSQVKNNSQTQQGPHFFQCLLLGS